jgi:hypothetical protein
LEIVPPSVQGASSTPDTGDEIPEVIAEQHDDPMIFRNVIAPHLFL